MLSLKCVLLWFSKEDDKGIETSSLTSICYMYKFMQRSSLLCKDQDLEAFYERYIGYKYEQESGPGESSWSDWDCVMEKFALQLTQTV